MKLFVANLSFDTQSEDLIKIFEVHGKVVSASVVQDRVTNRSRGFGFVEMDNKEAALLVIKELHDTTLQGRTIVVELATPKKEIHK